MGQSARDVRPSIAIVDLLGDFHRVGGMEFRLKSLASLGESLGVSGPTMRVTLARLRERGWFEVRREGRESVYRFTSTALRTLNEGGRRLLRPGPGEWSGEWDMAIYTVPESDRRTRDELRKQLIWLGFGPLAPATWINPHRRMDDLENVTTDLVEARLTLLTTRTTGLSADRALAARCWDLAVMGARYEKFITSLRRDIAGYEADALDHEAALAERIGLLNRYREASAGDPVLPEALQPAGWPGGDAHRLFERAHRALADRSRDHYRDALGLELNE